MPLLDAGLGSPSVRVQRSRHLDQLTVGPKGARLLGVCCTWGTDPQEGAPFVRGTRHLSSALRQAKRRREGRGGEEAQTWISSLLMALRLESRMGQEDRTIP